MIDTRKTLLVALLLLPLSAAGSESAAKYLNSTSYEENARTIFELIPETARGGMSTTEFLAGYREAMINAMKEEFSEAELQQALAALKRNRSEVPLEFKTRMGRLSAESLHWYSSKNQSPMIMYDPTYSQ